MEHRFESLELDLRFRISKSDSKIKILVRRKISNFDEISDLDQIEGAEFEFLGLETRFERNGKEEFRELDFDFRNRFRDATNFETVPKFEIWPAFCFAF